MWQPGSSSRDTLTGVFELTAEAVEAAAKRMVGVIPVTPLEPNARLSQLHGLEIWLKREDLQPVRSYKVRGAYNVVTQLSAAERERGVVCASAGNHAQGVAFACAAAQVQARVYLPRTTPRQKRDRVAAVGGAFVQVVIAGDTYDDAAAAAQAYADSSGALLIPAFDHPQTIAGQGTVMAEIVNQLGGPPDAVIVPVGGAGLIAGIVSWLKKRHPTVKVIGVEPGGAASLAAAIAAGEPVTLDDLDPFVDGAAVRRVGDLPFALLSAEVDLELTITSAPEGKVCEAMLELYQQDGIIAEPAGALAVAGLGPELDLPPGARVVCLLSGGNNDVSRYSEIVERALVFEGRKHYFLVEFPQEPGALRRFLDEVLGPEDDITLFEYIKRNNRETGPAIVGIELGSADDLAPMLERMARAPHRIEQLPPDSPMFSLVL